MRHGIAPDGSRYYPAFPYPNFTKLIRDDILAIRAYLATLAPISNRPPQAELRWPLNYRVLMREALKYIPMELDFIHEAENSATMCRSASGCRATCGTASMSATVRPFPAVTSGISASASAARSTRAG